MKTPYSPPTLRQLGRAELTPEQWEWIESEVRTRRGWRGQDTIAIVAAAGLLVLAIVLSVLLVSMVSGCASTEPPIYVDASFSESERAEVQAAADYWCRTTDGAACPDLVFGARVHMSHGDVGGRHVLVRATEAQAAQFAASGFSMHWGGDRWIVYDELGVRNGEVLVVVPSRVTDLRLIVAHELGHHFDMNHVAEPGALMFSEFLGAEARAHLDAWCLSLADAAELCHSHACGEPRECAP
jgi:hypothetical protein